MHWINIILYVFLGILIVAYIYILVADNGKTSVTFGRKKRVISILKKYSGITRRARKQIGNVVHELELHFFEYGEINYETLLDSLASIRRDHEGENESICQEIDIIVEYIQNTHPYLHISNATAALFSVLKNDIIRKDMDKANTDIELLYEKTREVETHLKKRSRREFWFGIILAIIGIAVSIITFLL